MVKVNAKVDTVVVDELESYIMNNVSNQYDSILKNYRGKIAKGTFDKAKGVKGLMVLINDGASNYAKEYGSQGDKWQKLFPMDVRKAVAESMLDSFLMDENLQIKGEDMNSKATDKSEETGGLIAKFGKLDFEATKKAVEGGEHSGEELDFLTKKLKGMQDMKDGKVSSKASLGKASQGRLAMAVKFGNQTNELLNYSKEFLGYMNDMSKAGKITVKSSATNVLAIAKDKAIFNEIVSKGDSMKSKASEDFDFTTLAEEVTCPMQDKADLMAQANDLGLTMIIASEISEKTGGMIAKHGKLKYDETKKAIDSGEHSGEDLDFLQKKYDGMTRMKEGNLKSKSMETDGSDELPKTEDKVSDVIPNATSFADEESVKDLIPTATKF